MSSVAGLEREEGRALLSEEGAKAKAE